MAIKLPPIAQAKPVAQATEAQTSSVAVYGDTGEEKPAAEAPRPAPYKIHDAAGADLGLKTYIPEEVAEELPPEQASVTNIVNHTLDVARLDELARTMLEIRGEVVEMVRRAGEAATWQQVKADIAAAQQTIGEFIGVNMGVVTKRLAEVETHIDAVSKDIITIGANKAHDLEMFLRRLDLVDATVSAVAAKHGVTHAITPTLSLRPARVLATKARLDGAVVILCYNPKQGRDGDEPQEFTIREQPRTIFTGYTVDVPTGYVCDVFVGADVVAALQGKGESELTVQMRSKSPYGRTVNSGSEICRLALRKMESLRVEIAAVQ